MTDPMYTAQQINIPPELPEILKSFTKAAIKTQPSDLLLWSAQYFDALANNRAPPVKARVQLTKTEVRPISASEYRGDWLRRASKRKRVSKSLRILLTPSAESSVSANHLIAVRTKVRDTL